MLSVLSVAQIETPQGAESTESSSGTHPVKISAGTHTHEARDNLQIKFIKGWSNPTQRAKPGDWTKKGHQWNEDTPDKDRAQVESSVNTDIH